MIIIIFIILIVVMGAERLPNICSIWIYNIIKISLSSTWMELW